MRHILIHSARRYPMELAGQHPGENDVRYLQFKVMLMEYGLVHPGGAVLWAFRVVHHASPDCYIWKVTWDDEQKHWSS